MALDRRLVRNLLLMGGIVAVYAILATFITNSYYQLMLTLVPVWAMFALAWNLFSGYSGLLSFGHATFFGIGAYTVALSASMLGISPWISIPIGACIGAVAGLGIGLISFRLRGHYFALAMLAYPLAILYVLEYLRLSEVVFPIQRTAPAAHMQFTDPRMYTYLALALAAVTFVLCAFIERSVFGFSLRAAGENEAAAEASGINTFSVRLRAFVLSAGLAAFAGGFYAVVLLIVTPHAVFGMLVSAQPMILTMFGGMGTIWGPVIGAAVLVPLSETLRAEFGSILPGIQGIVYGATIILVVMLAPQGVFWSIRERLTRRAPAPVAAEAAVVAPAVMETRPPVGKVLLQGSGLSRSFGGLRAVSEVSFSVREGEILGIIGPNGAGKTTLFNMLSGLITPTAGELAFEGRSIQGLRPNAICRAGIGRTFQVARSFPRMTLLENVTVGAYNVTKDKAEAEKAGRAALEKVGLPHRLDAAVSELTNKELRLMELARAIAGQPKLVLMDEPLAGLGRTESEEFLQLLKTLSSTGLTIVIIEHTMHVMVRLVDRLIVLDHGKLIAEGAPDEVLNQPEVTEAYLGKKWNRHANA